MTMRNDIDKQLDEIDRQDELDAHERRECCTPTPGEFKLVLKTILGSLKEANENGVIIDTIWTTGKCPETLFDYIASAIEAPQSPALGGEPEILGIDEKVFDIVCKERDQLKARLDELQCDHEWTDDGEFNLHCTKCGKQENHEPYGWVQTRGNAINRFTQEWDVVEEWEKQGFEYKAMFDAALSKTAGSEQ